MEIMQTCYGIIVNLMLCVCRVELSLLFIIFSLVVICLFLFVVCLCYHIMWWIKRNIGR